jgi:hypothetical protein
VAAFAQLDHHVGERSGFEDVPVAKAASPSILRLNYFNDYVLFSVGGVKFDKKTEKY